MDICFAFGLYSINVLIINLIFAAESFGFNTYQPAYLDLYFKDKNILNGANFASSASGYHNSTAILYVSPFKLSRVLNVSSIVKNMIFVQLNYTILRQLSLI
jgi:hypothetical protein